MKVSVPAITDKTREYINTCLNEKFKHENGDDLDSVVSEVLNDKDVFICLAAFLDKDKGLPLGEIEYCRYHGRGDMTVNYGLTIDFNHFPRRVYLYSLEESSDKKFEQSIQFPASPKLHVKFPVFPDKEYYIKHPPNPEEFAKTVNNVLQTNKNKLVDLNFTKQ